MSSVRKPASSRLPDISNEPPSDFSVPVNAHVSLAPSKALTDDGYLLDHPDIVNLHKHSKRTDGLPTDVKNVANHHGIAAHVVTDANHRDNLETLASIYSIKKERSSLIRETLNEIIDNIGKDIVSISQTFKNVYPQLHQKIRSRDTAGVDTIIKNLENIVRGLIRKAAHAVDVLEEAEKSVHYGKHFHDHLHQKAKGLLKDKNDCLDSIGGLLRPVRTIILIVEGSFSRTLVNLGIVKAEVDKGQSNPSVIFSDKSVDAVTKAWEDLKVQAEQHQSYDEILQTQ